MSFYEYYTLYLPIVKWQYSTIVLWWSFCAMTEWDDRFKREDGLYFWDRLESESGKHFAAFCIYRDLGKARSIDTASWLSRGYQVDSIPKTANGKMRRGNPRWLHWSAAFDWPARATQYDLYLELMARREREAKHLTDIDQYRERLRRMAAAATEGGLKLLAAGNKRLSGIEPSAIPVGALPAFYRAAAAVIEAAGSSEAQALAIDELMRLLDASDGDGE